MIKTSRLIPPANYQDLLKTIAIVAFIIDHIGFFMMYPEGMWMRAIGRCVMPIYCFYAGYNFSRPKHLIGLLGVILTFIAYKSFGLADTLLNMLLTIYTGQWYLYLLNKYSKKTDASTLIHCALLLLLTPITSKFMDYGTLVIAFMLIGQRAREGVEYRSFMPLLAISTMILVMMTFGDWFTIQNILLTTLSVLGAIFALTKVNHSAPISVDLRIISRNSLWIYFLNYGGHMLYFYYAYVLII